MSATSDAWPVYTPASAGQPVDAIFSHIASHAIYRIADIAERATLLAHLAANGVPATRVMAHRQDAPVGSELEYTTDGGTTWLTLRATDTTPGIGEYVKASAALDGTLAPVVFTESTALAGVTHSAGSFTFSSPGVYAITIRITSDDGTADTGHEVRLKRGTIMVGRSRAFAPAGGSGLGTIITPVTWVGAIRNSDAFTVEIDSIGAGGRSVVSAHMYIERLTY